MRDSPSPQTVRGNWPGSQMIPLHQGERQAALLTERAGPTSHQLVTVIMPSQAEQLLIIHFPRWLSAHFI